MAELHLPLDLKRLPEFRQLIQLLAERFKPTPAFPAESAAKLIECVALNLVWSLGEDMGYEAQRTNEPGQLSDGGRRLFESGWGQMFGDNANPLELLAESGWIAVGAQGFVSCLRIGKLNGHLAGNFQSRERKGAAASAVIRNRQMIVKEALQQANLLPPELFTKDENGARTPMTDTEVNRVMVTIKTIDHCLKLPGRNKTAYTEGLMLDAHRAITKYSEDLLRPFYTWLTLHRDSPGVPKETERVLAQIDSLIQLAK